MQRITLGDLGFFKNNCASQLNTIASSLQLPANWRTASQNSFPNQYQGIPNANPYQALPSAMSNTYQVQVLVALDHALNEYIDIAVDLCKGVTAKRYSLYETPMKPLLRMQELATNIHKTINNSSVPQLPLMRMVFLHVIGKKVFLEDLTSLWTNFTC